MTEDRAPLPTLNEIADFLDAHGRDDGGLSDKDRAWFAAAASAARRALPSGGDTEPDEQPSKDFIDGLVRSTHVQTDRLEFIWRTMPAAAKATNGSFENWLRGLDAAIEATPEFRGKPLPTVAALSAPTGEPRNDG